MPVIGPIQVGTRYHINCLILNNCTFDVELRLERCQIKKKKLLIWFSISHASNLISAHCVRPYSFQRFWRLFSHYACLDAIYQRHWKDIIG